MTVQPQMDEVSEVMGEIGVIVTSSLDTQEVYERFAEQVRKLIPADLISITLADFDQNTFTFVHTSPKDRIKRPVGWVGSLEGSVTQQAVDTGSGVMVHLDDPEQLAKTFPALVPLYRDGFRSQISVPLNSDGQAFGALHLSSYQQNAHEQKDLMLLERVAGQIAGAVATSRLYSELNRTTDEVLQGSGEEARRLAHENAVVAEIGRVISSSPEIEDVYGRFAEEVRKLVPFDRIVVNTVDLEHGTFANLYVTGVDVLHRRPGEVMPLAGTQVETVVYARASHLMQTQDKDELAGWFPGLVSSFDAGLRSFLSVPLVSRDRVIGSLNLRSSKPSAYSDDDLGLAERVGNQIAGVIANAQLHTERIQAEVALTESEKQYRWLYDNTPVMMHAIDRQGRLVNVNQHWLDTLGYERTEAIGRRSTEFLTESSRRYATEVTLPQFWKTGFARDVEYQVVKKNGEVMDVLLSAIAKRDKSGEVTQSLAFLVDVTERERLEEQLLQAQKMESVGRLAGGVAHDFNNLLTAIINFTYLATTKIPKRGEASDYLREAQAAAESATSLTSQLLAFSRRQVNEPRVLNLNDIIVDTHRMLRRLIGEDIELVTLQEPQLGLVKVDAGQIEQVLINLAVNARDAMPEGGKLAVETANVSLDEQFAKWHPETPAGEYIMLTVSDTGVGMTKEVQPHIFEPFFTTKEVDKGTGLGLSTCYGIVRQSGGHIEVQSEPERGTTFRIYLPRVEGAIDTLPLHDEARYLPAGSETVLLVEDEPLVRKVTVEMLRAQGYDVLEAANGTDAMRVASEHADEAINLLVTDVVMPLMGGAQLAEHFREVHPKAKVLYMSGYVDDTVVHERVLEERGAFLQKPFTAPLFARRVRETLDRDLSQV